MILDIDRCTQEDYRTGEKKALLPDSVAEQLVAALKIATIKETGEMLMWKNGAFVSGALEDISKIINSELGSLLNYKGAPMYNKKVKEEILDSIRDKTFISMKDFDQDLSLINMKNGFYNWVTNEFVPHNPETAMLYPSRIQIPIEYDPDATCDRLDRILRKIILPEDYIKILEFIAYIFYRQYEIQKAFIFYGPGGTGKSAFLSMLDKMVGSNNCAAVSLKRMERSFVVETLNGKLLNKCGELDGKTVNDVDVFKGLTSGEDSILTEKKYGNPYVMVNTAKIAWATNTLPPINESAIGYDDSFYRRIEIIMFLHKFTPEEYDPADMALMEDMKQLSGLFNKCIKLLPELLRRHDFTNPGTAETNRKLYKSIADPLKTFMDEHVIVCPGSEVHCEILYDRYIEHCNQYLVQPMHYNDFLNQAPTIIKCIKRSEQKIKKGRSICCFRGIKINYPNTTV